MASGEYDEDKFLCERFAFSRWITDTKTITKERLRKIKVIIPTDTDLKYALDERDWICSFAEKNGLNFSVDSTYEQVMQTLRDGDFDLIHICTHGAQVKDNPLSSFIEVQGRRKIKAEIISGKARKFGKVNPLVIMNSCQSGMRGFSLTRIRELGYTFH